MLRRWHYRITDSNFRNIIHFIVVLDKQKTCTPFASSKLLSSPQFPRSIYNTKTRHFATNTLKTCATVCSMVNARKMFDKTPQRDDDVGFSWNAAIAWRVKQGHGKEALELFCEMQIQGLKPNQFILSTVLNACSKLSAMEEGKQIHAYTVKSGVESDIFVASTLLDVYVKCGSVQSASQVFDKMPQRNVVSWTAMMVGFVHHGYAEDALELYQQMQSQTIRLNSKSFAIVISACAHLEAMEEGEQVHAYIIKTGFESNLSVSNGLLSLYAKCGNTDYVSKVFNRMNNMDMVSWNAIISGYTHCGNDREALECYHKMQLTGIGSDSITLLSVLSSCANLEALEQGKQVHAKVVETGLMFSVSVGNALITMYAKSGSIEDSGKVFREMLEKDLTSWNAMIGTYVQGYHVQQALGLFHQMQQKAVGMNYITCASILGAFKTPATLEHGKQLHAHIIKAGFESQRIVRNALLTMYGYCGSIGNSKKLFFEMPKEDVDSWNAMIAAYTQNGLGEESLKLFRQMRRIGMNLDNFTLATTLATCASLVALENGKHVHAAMIRSRFHSDIIVGTALVDMYAKCGSIEDARHVFDNMLERSDFSWNTMIGGYARHGYVEEALKLFVEMQQAGVKPDHVTFVNVLSACSHAGLLDKGRSYFDSMNRKYGITPKLEHYACMVDILGRAGCLDEAEDLISKMPVPPSCLVWRSLLGACRVHGNLDIGRRAAECLLELSPYDAATHLLLSQIYAVAGKWDDVAKMRTMTKDLKVKKEPGCSWIEIKNRLYVFIAEDRRYL